VGENMCGDRTDINRQHEEEKQTDRKMCRLQIKEAGLRMFKGK
jgi:hypothetical protein